MDNLNDIFSTLPYAIHTFERVNELMGSRGNESADYTLRAKIYGEGIDGEFVPIQSIGEFIPTLSELCDSLIAYTTTYALTPKRIIRNGPATIVFWADDTKTIVKCAPDEEDNAYAAFTAALAIKIFGSNSGLKKLIKEKTVVQK